MVAVKRAVFKQGKCHGSKAVRSALGFGCQSPGEAFGYPLRYLLHSCSSAGHVTDETITETYRGYDHGNILGFTPLASSSISCTFLFPA